MEPISDDNDFLDYEEPDVSSIEELISDFFIRSNERLVHDIYDQDGLNSSIVSLFNYMSSYIEPDPIDDILNESLHEQTSSKYNPDKNILISSTSFATLNDSIQKDNYNCIICSDDFDKDSIISITNCNHIYHTDCIKEWAKHKSENPDCPICRKKLE